MAYDLQAVGNALATTVGTQTATSGTTSETATATADLPDTVGALALLIYPPDTADLHIITGPKLDDHYAFVIRLLRDPMTMPMRTRMLYAWATVLRTSVQAHYQLGASAYGVMQAEARSMRIEPDGQKYASAASNTVGTFDVVEIEVDVHVYALTTVTI